MPESCPSCNEPFRPHERHCVHCGSDLGFPNVRACETSKEQQALTQRYQSARQDLSDRGCDTVADEFEQAVRQSKAVFCRPMRIMSSVLNSDSDMFATFHKLTSAGARRPEDNEYDIARQSVESTLFPYYFQHIQFAALSLDGKGASGWGECSLILRDSMIAKRTSVLEGNCIHLLRSLRVIAGDPLPTGFRAAWKNRDKLALAKLHAQIDTKMESDQFPALLLDGDTREKQEFIEVHIYGELTGKTVESVRMQKPKNRKDAIIVKNMQSRLRQRGVNVELYD